jgi:glycosyltransferase involved in cell wall biosynthesis
MRIAIVAPTAIPSRRANTIQIMKMSQAFSNLGHAVRLVAPWDGKGSSLPPNPTRESLARHYGLSATADLPMDTPPDFSVEWLPAHPRLRRYDFSWRSVRWARRWGAEILFTRLPQAAAISSQSGLPAILEMHDLPAGAMGPLLIRLFLSGKGARRLVVITSALGKDLQARYGIPNPADPPDAFTILAPDGVDLARYTNLPTPSAARHQLGLPLPERFTAGYTGHLYTGRGVELILALAKRLPEMNFLLVGGEPSQIDMLMQQVSDQGLDNVCVAGFIPNADLPLYQAACEALLMPYQYQVAASSGGDIAPYLSPMKVFEYMACGRAIVSSNLEVLQEVLHQGNAILLPPSDVDAWRDALRWLAARPEESQALARQARQEAEKYTWEQRAWRILEGALPKKELLIGDQN